MPRQRHQEPKPFQRKDGVWCIRPWVDVIDESGKLARAKRTIPLCGPEKGKREAVRLKGEVMATINRADYVIQSQVRLRDFLVIYDRSHVARLASSTRVKYRSHIKNHIAPAFAELALCEITTRRVSDWIAEKETARMSWATRMDIRNILSSIFTKAIEWGNWKDRNPIEPVYVGRRKAAREQRKLTDEQTRRLLAALPFEARLAACVGLFCTLRVSEIFGLQEKHLDFENGLIRVRQRYYRGDIDETKSDRARRDVPMGYLAEDLKRLCAGDPERFVFQIPTRPRWGREKALCRDDRDILQHFLRPAAVELGFYWKGFGWHSLRREAVTAIGSVIGIGQASRMAGHAKVDMSLHYTLADRSGQDEAVRAFQERIVGKTGEKIQ